MAIVTRKFTCKDCETESKITFSQEEIREKNEPTKDEEYLILLGLCKGCFDDKIE